MLQGRGARQRPFDPVHPVSEEEMETSVLHREEGGGQAQGGGGVRKQDLAHGLQKIERQGPGRTDHDPRTDDADLQAGDHSAHVEYERWPIPETQVPAPPGVQARRLLRQEHRAQDQGRHHTQALDPAEDRPDPPRSGEQAGGADLREDQKTQGLGRRLKLHRGSHPEQGQEDLQEHKRPSQRSSQLRSHGPPSFLAEPSPAHHVQAEDNRQRGGRGHPYQTQNPGGATQKDQPGSQHGPGLVQQSALLRQENPEGFRYTLEDRHEQEQRHHDQEAAELYLLHGKEENRKSLQGEKPENGADVENEKKKNFVYYCAAN